MRMMEMDIDIAKKIPGLLEGIDYYKEIIGWLSESKMLLLETELKCFIKGRPKEQVEASDRLRLVVLEFCKIHLNELEKELEKLKGIEQSRRDIQNQLTNFERKYEQLVSSNTRNEEDIKEQLNIIKQQEQQLLLLHEKKREEFNKLTLDIDQLTSDKDALTARNEGFSKRLIETENELKIEKDKRIINDDKLKTIENKYGFTKHPISS